MKILFILFTCFFLGLSAPGCSFDPGGIPSDNEPDAGLADDSDAGDEPVICGSDKDCDDGDDCTVDVCASDGTCRNVPTNSDVCEEPEPACGDDVCDDDEDHASCPADCDAPEPAIHRIHCDNVDGTRVTITGDIKSAIVVDSGDLPGTPGTVSLGANQGLGAGAYWPSVNGGYNTAHPKCTVAVNGDGTWTCAGTIGFGDSVQGWNFFVANSANSALRYFRLADWEVTGYCAKGAGGGLLCSCESLPCSCPF